MSEFLTPEDVYRELGIDERELQELIAQGRLHPLSHEAPRFSRDEVESLRELWEEDAVLVDTSTREPSLSLSRDDVRNLPEAPRKTFAARFLTAIANFLFWRPPKQRLIRERLLAGGRRAHVATSDSWMHWIRGALEVLFLTGVARFYDRKLRAAGYRVADAGGFYVLGKLILLCGVGVSLWVWGEPLGLPWKFSIAAGAWVLPDVLLWLSIRRYRGRIEKDLPFWLDLHSTLVEGGIGFDEALVRICAETEFLKRPIFGELQEMRRRIGLGTPRSAALRGMADRLEVEGLDAVVGAIVQGEQMGAGIADTLRAQADMIRNKVWEDAQTRAHKLPVKLIFPIAVGVLPALFLITIGPTVFRFLSFLYSGRIPDIPR